MRLRHREDDFPTSARAYSSVSAPRRHTDCHVAVSRRLFAQQPAEHLIEVIADHDSRYKIPGQDKPVITVTSGESVRLRITAIKAKNHARDGSVHGFSLLRASDHVPVPGWDLLLKPGTRNLFSARPTNRANIWLFAPLYAAPIMNK